MPAGHGGSFHDCFSHKRRPRPYRVDGQKGMTEEITLLSDFGVPELVEQRMSVFLQSQMPAEYSPEIHVLNSDGFWKFRVDMLKDKDSISVRMLSHLATMHGSMLTLRDTNSHAFEGLQLDHDYLDYAVIFHDLIGTSLKKIAINNPSDNLTCQLCMPREQCNRLCFYPVFDDPVTRPCLKRCAFWYLHPGGEHRCSEHYALPFPEQKKDALALEDQKAEVSNDFEPDSSQESMKTFRSMNLQLLEEESGRNSFPDLASFSKLIVLQINDALFDHLFDHYSFLEVGSVNDLDSLKDSTVHATYRNVVGMLIYISPWRSDLKFEVHLLSCKVKDPTSSDERKLVQLLKYSIGAKTMLLLATASMCLPVVGANGESGIHISHSVDSSLFLLTVTLITILSGLVYLRCTKTEEIKQGSRSQRPEFVNVGTQTDVEYIATFVL